jgi:ABC-2 type transport system permease protein
MLLFALFLTWGAARVFRVGLLMQGKQPKLSEIVRWAWRG